MTWHSKSTGLMARLGPAESMDLVVGPARARYAVRAASGRTGWGGPW